MTFPEFLITCWKKTPRPHHYQIPARSKAWQQFNQGLATWTAESLSEAYEKYFWHGNFESNLEKLTRLKGRFGRSLDIGNDQEANCVVREIFRWGGLGGGGTRIG
jgi:hypothetical protein